MNKILFFLLVSLLLAGCATVTVPRTVYRPWSRTISGQDIQAGSEISVTVHTQSTPLLGSEQLVENRIAEKATALLERRGFSIRDNNPQYKLKITYQVAPGVKEYTSTSTYSGSKSATFTRSTNLGVMLAQTVAAAMTQSAVQTQITSVKYDVYNHLVSCEMFNQSDHLVWKYDSRTSTGNIDILDVYTPLLQVAFSSLPSSGEVIPRVPKLKYGRFDDFAKMYIKNRNFLCPALPNYIKMAQYIWSESDQAAILAFLDLLETAEYAIPNNTRRSSRNPTDIYLWTKVTLIGKYYLGNDTTPVNVVILLSGTESSYEVTTARLVSDEVYAKLQEHYNQWVAQLRDFYDFYED
ncbi:MAG: hypothetical protein PHG32_02345 [Candidatus Cloacimonetes bacterium]|nr:hypothetical protein [Candidatus Cloacimonadota bacterium]